MGSALIRIFERPFYRKLHQPGEIGTTSACAENTQPSRTLPKTSGTTSACAENTAGYREGGPHLGNYLRVRGEYLPAAIEAKRMAELPPRARRILRRTNKCMTNSGTTSAHAENTGAAASSTPNPRNYLRAHGEYLNELGLLWHDSQKWAKIRSGI